MNEITKIHLGRQPFVIAVDAHKALQEYLHEIKRHVGKNASVVDEVEVRMAELLAERGITGDKVVLPEDVAFLKEQLGAPRDFEDDEAADGPGPNDEQPEVVRRLFRDTEHGMVAGVSAGLANYLKIDPVIVRILFVLATITGGWGILAYIVLWLVVPEAKTASERLQMRGKAVTVDTLKEIVDRADVPGAAHRFSRTLAVILGVIARIVLTAFGIFLAIMAFGALGLIAAAVVHALMHNGHLVYGAVQFPLGSTERVAVAGGLAMLGSMAAFVLAASIAMIRRKWTVPAWAVAALAGVFMLGLVAGGATVTDTVQNVHDRYSAAFQTDTRTVTAFDRVRVIHGSADIPVNYDVPIDTMDMPGVDASLPQPTATSYQIKIRHPKSVDAGAIKTTVKDKELTIDTRGFQPGAYWDCDGFCIGNKDYSGITVQSDQRVHELPVTTE